MAKLDNAARHRKKMGWLEPRGRTGLARPPWKPSAGNRLHSRPGGCRAPSLVRLAQTVLGLDRQLIELITSLTGIGDVLGAEFLAVVGGSLPGCICRLLGGQRSPRTRAAQLRLRRWQPGPGPPQRYKRPARV